MNNFSETDGISPYKENFRSFVAAPILDWSLVFKPQFLAFFVLPPDRALSFYFFFFYGAFVVGYAWLLRRLGAGPGVAVLVALICLTSQLPQAWWTQRAPLYAFAPWPLLAFLSRGSWYLRLPLITWATAAWLLGEFYPPAIIGNIFAWAVILLGFCREEFSLPNLPTRLVPGLLAVAAGAGIVWFYFSDLIPLMQDTVYPGRRISGGGGISWTMILAHLLPNFATMGYLPVIDASNVCEVAVVGTFLPLMLAVFADHRGLAAWARDNRPSLAVWLGGMALMIVWMTCPVPPAFGVPFLWHRSRPGALLWGFGLLLTIGSAVIFSKAPLRFGTSRAILFGSIVGTGWLLSKGVLLSADSEAGLVAHSLREKLSVGRWDLFVLAPGAAVVLAHWLRPAWTAARLRPLLLACSLLPLAATFGRFNPIVSSKAIMTRETTPLIETIRELAAANPHGWAAVNGQHGMVLNAFGVPSIGQTLFHPELPFFRKLYPDMPEDQFTWIFNRYAQIFLDYKSHPALPRPDVIALPIFDVGTPLPVVAEEEGATATACGSGSIDRIFEAEPPQGSRHQLVVTGWAPFAGIAPQQQLVVSAEGGHILSAKAVREPRLDVSAKFGDPALANAGYAMELTVEPSDPGNAAALGPLKVRGTDRGRTLCTPGSLPAAR